MNWIGGSDVRDVAVICGPTAAGKSAVAMALAERTGAMVISADSRQVYRRFDIGTAKPSADDRRRVDHRGVDVIDPIERYSAAAWCRDAMAWFADADTRRRPVILVGGTGFYLRALTEPLFDSPPLDPEQRAVVRARLDARPTDALRLECLRVDPARAPFGRTQLLRALEIHALTGRTLSEWMVERQRPSLVRAHYLLVDPGVSLRERIASRVQAMLDAGWEAEVAALMRDVPADAPAWNACGYAALRAAADGAIARRHAIERIVIETRQYAKRQRTWFRHQLLPAAVTLLDPAAPDATSASAGWLERVTPTEHP